MTDPWDIYAIGDPDFLYFVLQGIAMLAGGNDEGSGTLGQVAKLGALVGLLTVCVKAVMTAGQKFEIHMVLLGMILFMALFAPKTTVQITPINLSGAIQPTTCRNGCVIDNVPLGLAAIGAFISQVGVVLTERTEQAFSSVSTGYKPLPLMAGGFGRTMEALAALREIENPSRPLHGDAGAYRESLKTYVAECWLVRVNQLEEQPNRIYTVDDVLGPSTVGGIGYDTQWATTQTFIKATSGGADAGIGLQRAEAVTCRTAYQRLLAHKAKIPEWLNVQIGNLKGFRTASSADPGDSGIPPFARDWLSDVNAGEELSEVLTNTFDSIMPDAGFDAQNYMAAAMMKSVITDAVRTGAGSDQRSMMSALVAQGAEQRAMDAAGQESMFLRMLRPMTSFFESMVYVLAPFMTFAIFLGQPGINMLTKYMLMTLWVSLWPFTLAIINLWSNVQIEKSLLAMAEAMKQTNGSSSINSISFLTQVHSEAIDWLTTGAMLTAATPFITLGLLMGGAVTMTSLAGKLGQQDFTNEKLAAPDAVQPSAYMSQSSSMSSDPMAGMRVTNSDGYQTQISTSAVSQNAVSSASQQMLQTGNTLTDAISRMTATNTAASNAFGTGFKESVANNTSSENKLLTSWTQKQGVTDSLRSATGWSNEEVTSYLMSGGLTQAVKGMAKGLLNMQDGSSTQRALSGATELQEAYNNEVSKGGSFAHAVAKVQSYATEAGVNAAASHGLSKADSTQLSDAATEARTSADSWSSTNTALSSLGGSRTFSTGVFAQWMANNPNAESIRDSADLSIRQAGLEGVYGEQLAHVKSREGLDGQAAQDAARLLTLAGLGGAYASNSLVYDRPRDAADIAAQADGFANLVGAVAGVGPGAAEFVSHSGADQNLGINDASPARSVRDDARSLTGGPTAAAVDAAAASTIKRVGTELDGAPQVEAPESRVDAVTHSNAVWNNGQGMLRGLADEKRDDIYDQAGNLTNVSQDAGGVRNYLGNLAWLTERGTSPEQGLEMIKQAGAERFPHDDDRSREARELYMATMSDAWGFGNVPGAEEAYADLHAARYHNGALSPAQVEAVIAQAGLDANQVRSSGRVGEDQFGLVSSSGGNSNIVFDDLQAQAARGAR